MAKLPTVLLSKISMLLRVFSENGMNINELLASEGIDPSMLNLPDSRITLDNVHSIMNKAVALTGDKDFGLHQGEIYPGLSSIYCYVIMNCENLGMAIEKLCKYQAIVDETKKINVIYERDVTSIFVSYAMDYYDRDKQLIDYQLCGLYSFFNFLTGKDLLLKEVRFRHTCPDDISEYDRIFNCPLVFESNTNAIVIDEKLLKTRLLQPNKELLVLFERYAERVLNNYIDSKSYTKQVVDLILNNLGNSAVSLKATAKQMGLGVRNLQMKLRSEKTSYSKLLTEIRIDLAIDHLNDHHIAISEIAYILGFSEPSAFHRFFKKQTGDTPFNYRMNTSKTVIS
jgi:AraC-like DNA-binding protein